MKPTAIQVVYLTLALLGIAGTGYFNFQFFGAGETPGIGDFVAGGFANPAASSLTLDVLIAFLAFLVWLPTEARRLEMRGWWIYLVLGLTVAFAFAFPLFLFMRDRRLSEIDAMATTA